MDFETMAVHVRPGGGLCFASGMAATTTVLHTLAPGDHLATRTAAR
jgi:cystathionine beta-lyase/cystathionine gamma-synthase